MKDFFENYRKKIIELKNSNVSEAVTKSNLIEPLLKFLGWDIHNFKEVQHERRVISGNFVDYALKIDEKPKLYLEAKKINDDLNNYKIVSQAVGYANDDGVEWCLITNGDKLKLYKTRGSGNLREKLALEIRISNHYHLEFLEYFKKENIEKDVLETELNQILLTNKVIKVLEDISNKLPDDFIKYIKSTTRGLNESQIKEALKNIDMQFENTFLPEEIVVSEEFPEEVKKVIEELYNRSKFQAVKEFIDKWKNKFELRGTLYYLAFKDRSENNTILRLYIRKTKKLKITLIPILSLVELKERFPNLNIREDPDRHDLPITITELTSEEDVSKFLNFISEGLEDFLKN